MPIYAQFSFVEDLSTRMKGEVLRGNERQFLGLTWTVSFTYTDSFASFTLYCKAADYREEVVELLTHVTMTVESPTDASENRVRSRIKGICKLGCGMLNNCFVSRLSIPNLGQKTIQNFVRDDGHVRIVVNVDVLKLVGVRLKSRFEFDKPQATTDPSDRGVLRVGEHTFHVAKSILSADSEWFAEKFRASDEVVVSGIDNSAVFEKLLAIVYGEAFVEHDEVETLLEYTNRFGLVKAKETIVEHLLLTSFESVSMANKIKIALRFNLESLMSSVVDSVRTESHLDELPLHTMDSELVATIFDRLTKNSTAPRN